MSVVPKICPKCNEPGEIEVEVIAWMTHRDGKSICLNEHAGISDKENAYAVCCNCGHQWVLPNTQ